MNLWDHQIKSIKRQIPQLECIFNSFAFAFAFEMPNKIELISIKLFNMKLLKKNAGGIIKCWPIVWMKR